MKASKNRLLAAQLIICAGWLVIFSVGQWQALVYLLIPVWALLTFFMLQRFPTVLAAVFLSAYVAGVSADRLQVEIRGVLVILIWIAALVVWLRRLGSATQSVPLVSTRIRHDLRTPANLIVGFCDILLSTSARESLLPSQREHIEAVSRNAKTLQQVIDELFSASGQKPAEPEKADTGSAKRSLILLDKAGTAFEAFRQNAVRYNVVPVASVEAIGQLDREINPIAIVINSDDPPLLADVVDKQLPIVTFSVVKHDTQQYLMKPVQFEALSTALYGLATLLKNVLIIDDNVDGASMISHMVRSMPEHPQVTNAYSGREAIALLREQAAPDVIILDFVLPDMNGFSLLDYLRSEGGLAQIPIMLVSAHRPQDILKQSSISRLSVFQMVGMSPTSCVRSIEAMLAVLEQE